MHGYGWADQLGYGFCHECKPDDRGALDSYTAEPAETCERCGRVIVDVPHPENGSEGIYETTVCRIF